MSPPQQQQPQVAAGQSMAAAGVDSTGVSRFSHFLSSPTRCTKGLSLADHDVINPPPISLLLIPIFNPLLLDLLWSMHYTEST
jgi:hypothetical protein